VPEEKKLSPEEIEMFVAVLEKVERRRRIMLGGYLLAIAMLFCGEIGALITVGLAGRHARVGWVFLVPFALTGVILWSFGKWSKRIR
jgi:hypothetical protein